LAILNITGELDLTLLGDGERLFTGDGALFFGDVANIGCLSVSTE
jgi:hypothetical protein